MNISIHRPKPKIYTLGDNFSFFLAGIIDGNGHLCPIPQLVITFAEEDIRLAYTLKKLVKYGTVKGFKNEKNVKYVLSHTKGLEIVALKVRHKLQDSQKITQYNTCLKVLPNFPGDSLYTPFVYTENAWFSGFFCTYGIFKICVLNKEKRALPEIRLVIEIDKKENSLLLSIKEAFGGSISFRESQNTYIYSSVSFTAAAKIIKYFDVFPLMGVKQRQYVLWRKVYLKIQEKAHLTGEGVLWIKKAKERLK